MFTSLGADVSKHIFFYEYENDDKFALRAQVLMAGALSVGVTNQFNF